MNSPTHARCRLQVATLGDSASATTCAMIVARRHHYGRIPSGSFEEAIALVKSGTAQAALVPGAYPGIGNFLQDPELYLARCFAAPIPALVLAAKPKGRPPFREIHAHPATRPFWSQFGTPVIEAASNDVAAAAVTGKRIACITNETAAKRAGLHLLQILRPAAPMSWNLFVRADAVRPKGNAPLPAMNTAKTESPTTLEIVTA